MAVPAAPRDDADKAAEPAASPLGGRAKAIGRNRRVAIDERQELRLRGADAVILDKGKIEGLFKDLKLDAIEFPLMDIKKIVVRWSGAPIPKAQPEKPGAVRKGPSYADISLGDGGVLTIIVQQGVVDRGTRIPVGC